VPASEQKGEGVKGVEEQEQVVEVENNLNKDIPPAVEEVQESLDSPKNQKTKNLSLGVIIVILLASIGAAVSIAIGLSSL
jgi:hypothetical protein